MAAAPKPLPRELHRPLSTLHLIWQDARVEAIAVPWAQAQYFEKKKSLFFWYLFADYADRRLERQQRLLFLFLPLGVTVGVEHLHVFAEEFREACDHVVWVASKFGPRLTDLNQHAGLIWEALRYDELRVNKLTCWGVPEYELISPGERAPVLQELGLTEATLDQMPLLLFREDPIARLLGLRLGDIIRERLPNIVSGEEIRYRYVTHRDD